MILRLILMSLLDVVLLHRNLYGRGFFQTLILSRYPKLDSLLQMNLHDVTLVLSLRNNFWFFRHIAYLSVTLLSLDLVVISLSKANQVFSMNLRFCLVLIKLRREVLRLFLLENGTLKGRLMLQSAIRSSSYFRQKWNVNRREVLGGLSFSYVGDTFFVLIAI
jgi:hypothetical protein